MKIPAWAGFCLEPRNENNMFQDPIRLFELALGLSALMSALGAYRLFNLFKVEHAHIKKTVPRLGNHKDFVTYLEVSDNLQNRRESAGTSVATPVVVVAVVVVAASSSLPPSLSTKLTASSATITPVRMAAIRMRVGVVRAVSISRRRLAARRWGRGSRASINPRHPGRSSHVPDPLALGSRYPAVTGRHRIQRSSPMSTHRSALTMGAAALALTLGLSGCGGSSVESSDVEKQISSELGKQIDQTIDSVDCPNDLKAEVGEEETCTLTADGEDYDVAVKVTKVDGDNVSFDINVEG